MPRDAVSRRQMLNAPLGINGLKEVQIPKLGGSTTQLSESVRIGCACCTRTAKCCDVRAQEIKSACSQDLKQNKI